MNKLTLRCLSLMRGMPSSSAYWQFLCLISLLSVRQCLVRHCLSLACWAAAQRCWHVVIHQQANAISSAVRPSVCPVRPSVRSFIGRSL